MMVDLTEVRSNAEHHQRSGEIFVVAHPIDVDWIVIDPFVFAFDTESDVVRHEIFQADPENSGEFRGVAFDIMAPRNGLAVVQSQKSNARTRDEIGHPTAVGERITETEFGR